MIEDTFLDIFVIDHKSRVPNPHIFDAERRISTSHAVNRFFSMLFLPSAAK